MRIHIAAKLRKGQFWNYVLQLVSLTTCKNRRPNNYLSTMNPLWSDCLKVILNLETHMVVRKQDKEEEGLCLCKLILGLLKKGSIIWEAWFFSFYADRFPIMQVHMKKVGSHFPFPEFSLLRNMLVPLQKIGPQFYC